MPFLLALALCAGCKQGAPGVEDDKVGRSTDATCPEDEPLTQASCATDGQTCTYENGGCSRVRKCVKGEWSFESNVCNYPACPSDKMPSDGDGCSDASLVCMYGYQPVPLEAACVNTQWVEFTCSDKTGKWQAQWYDSFCSQCPAEIPKAGDPCNYYEWDPLCLLPTTIDCGGMMIQSTTQVICEQKGDGAHWRVDPPACPSK